MSMFIENRDQTRFNQAYDLRDIRLNIYAQKEKSGGIALICDLCDDNGYPTTLRTSGHLTLSIIDANGQRKSLAVKEIETLGFGRFRFSISKDHLARPDNSFSLELYDCDLNKICVRDVKSASLNRMNVKRGQQFRP